MYSAVYLYSIYHQLMKDYIMRDPKQKIRHFFADFSSKEIRKPEINRVKYLTSTPLDETLIRVSNQLISFYIFPIV